MWNKIATKCSTRRLLYSYIRWSMFSLTLGQNVGSMSLMLAFDLFWAYWRPHFLLNILNKYVASATILLEPHTFQIKMSVTFCRTLFSKKYVPMIPPEHKRTQKSWFWLTNDSRILICLLTNLLRSLIAENHITYSLLSVQSMNHSRYWWRLKWPVGFISSDLNF